MHDPNVSFFARLWLALVCLVRVVYDVEFARRVAIVRDTNALPPAPTAAELPPAAAPAAPMTWTAAAQITAAAGQARDDAAAKAAAAKAASDASAKAADASAKTASDAAAKAAAAPAKTAAALAVDPNAQALHLLALLQREGRLLDFLEEELAGFNDATIGAAARTVHTGCRKAIRQTFDLQPVRTEAEGAAVNLPAGFDAASVRLTGNVVGSPPFKGTLRHHGWRAAEVKLGPPPSGQPATLLAPAEVELT
jgi:hypothetical protein